METILLGMRPPRRSAHHRPGVRQPTTGLGYELRELIETIRFRRIRRPAHHRPGKEAHGSQLLEAWKQKLSKCFGLG